MHKKIGIIGGLSPESTVSYYLHITRSYVERFGDYGYPEIIIYSVNLKNYHEWRSQNKWELIVKDLVGAARSLESSGADFGIIATNTMHKVFDLVQSSVSLPFIHIMDATLERIKEKGIHKIGLLGTKYTMREDFYRERLASNGLTTLVPDERDQDVIHQIIVNELVRGKILEESREKYLKIIDQMRQEGAEAIILGCTEIPLLIKQEYCSVPLFDTATIHAEAALEKAIR